jgi:hypothetical protein
MEPTTESSTWRRSSKDRTGCFLAALCCGLLGTGLLIFLLPDCSATSKQARMARSLSQERLGELHRAMTALWAAIPEEERDFARVHFSAGQIPKEFEGLNARLVRIRSDDSIIRLQGCMDHHLDLMFHGVGEPISQHEDPTPRITLGSGEFDRRVEVLWREEVPTLRESSSPIPASESRE